VNEHRLTSLSFLSSKGSASAWIGATVGSVVAFWFGRTLLRKWAAKKLRSNPKLRALDRAIGNNNQQENDVNELVLILMVHR